MDVLQQITNLTPIKFLVITKTHLSLLNEDFPLPYSWWLDFDSPLQQLLSKIQKIVINNGESMFWIWGKSNLLEML